MGVEDGHDAQHDGEIQLCKELCTEVHIHHSENRCTPLCAMNHAVTHWEICGASDIVNQPFDS